MRGIPSLITDIRKKVFTEVARMAYEGGDYTKAEDLPYIIVPGDKALHRESIFLERAIAGERVRLAMGLSIRPIQSRTLMTEGMDQAAIAESYYEPPLINIIPYACHACPTKQYKVTQFCQNCLAASCQKVCPKGAISFVNGKSQIDPDKCIKCGKCAKACPYNAIIYIERPCMAACGMDAIESDDNGKAVINQDKCVACGQCLVSCPFGAIVDKGQIFQVVRSIMEGNKVAAIVAPAFIGQFGKESTPEKFTTAMKMLGFDRVVEVAVGADMCTIEEAEDFLMRVPAEQDFMATSCCPAWHAMVEKLFPAQFENISMTLTPMVFTARLVKKQDPDCKVVFVGPCAAKKLEANRRTVRSDVDFVLTFQEVEKFFDAMNLKPQKLSSDEREHSSRAGRIYARTSGVSEAVRTTVEQLNPGKKVKVKAEQADGVLACKDLIERIRNGETDGNFFEGMACSGGCVGGPKVLIPKEEGKEFVNRYGEEAAYKTPLENPYVKELLKRLGFTDIMDFLEHSDLLTRSFVSGDSR